MAKLILWNSIAKRRRSISDTFYDNGLATLRGYLQDKGHEIEIIDWARNDFFQSLTPLFLARWLRSIYVAMKKSKSPFKRKLLGIFSIQLQELLGMIQDARLKKHLNAFARKLKNDNVRIVGVKLWYGEAYQNAKYLVRLLKKISPQTITIAGGYHVTLYEKLLMQDSGFDLGVVCEGEFALDDILKIIDGAQGEWNKDAVLDAIAARAQAGAIENLLYRKGSEIVQTKRRDVKIHSSKCIPQYTLDQEKVSIHVMVESLGCDWGKCHFCVHPQFYPNYALRDPEEIVAEIKSMIGNGIGVFRFAGSDTPPAFGARIASRIKENNLHVVFGMGSRAIRNAKGQFDALVASYATLIRGGMRAVFMGGETGNDIINDLVMNKGIGFEDIVWSIKALREAEKQVGEKVFLSLAFIFPAPLMGKVTLQQVEEDNMCLLKETMPDSVMITPPGPFLHTKWYNEKDKFGFQVDSSIIKTAMSYEYVLYKPPHLWPTLNISLEGRSFKELLAECNTFRIRVENELHIPTDISDEHFLMFYAAGVRSFQQIEKMKTETMLDIVSCDYTVTNELSRKVNEFSRKLTQG